MASCKEGKRRLKKKSSVFLLVFFFLFAIATIRVLAQSESTLDSECPSPVLSRLQSHTIAGGETVESIAGRYNLIPDTIVRLNPVLEGDSLPVGAEIFIPPMNGVRLEVPSGTTWQDLEAAYGVRADVLFELNGCQGKPSVVFIPGVNWSPQESSTVNNYSGLSGYPLPSVAKVGLTYGWKTDPTNQGRMFHSGIDLLAASGTPVLTAESGVVAYVGEEGNYGNLVVVSHQGGLQTRYAHLNTIKVASGQQVKTGDVLGTVGSTGRPDIQATHLHFEVRQQAPVGWVAQDPEIHLR